MEAMVPGGVAPYPVRLEGHLEQPSRWLWLVKWLLALPHFVVLAFLWLGFAVLSVGAFLVLLFGGSYPRGAFSYNVGVLRWTWRVLFYAFAANGTDRYPPFTLDDVPDYPARLAIAYPADQRHGFRLIGWWLAGIPQYVVAGVFAGGSMLAWQAGRGWSLAWPGLIAVLVLSGLVVLLFRGVYPRSLFDFVLGLDRWVLRVVAYSALLTREYPPFRVDHGERDPGGLDVSAAAAPGGQLAFGQVAPSRSAVEARRWGPGRVVTLVLGSLAVVTALGILAAGIGAVVIDQTARDADGFLTAGTRTYATATYALVSERYRPGTAADPLVAKDLLGRVRLRVTSATPVFLGIGPADAVDRYLQGVSHEAATGMAPRPGAFRLQTGAAPGSPPTAQGFWVAQAAGSGRQELVWTPADGTWRVVLMNADGSGGVRAALSAGAEVPHLLWIGIGVLGAGALLLLLGGIVVYAAVPHGRPEVVDVG